MMKITPWFAAVAVSTLVFTRPVAAQISLTPASQPAPAAPSGNLEQQVGEALQLYEAGKGDEAAGMLSRLASENPRSGLVWLALGRVYEGLGRNNNAQQAYERAVRFEPQAMATNLALGSLYTKMGLPRQAVPLLTVARQVAPNNANVAATLAMALAQLPGEGDRKRAIEMFGEAVRLDPGQPDYRFRLGVFLAAAGNTTEGLDQVLLATRQGLDQMRAAPLDGQVLNQADQFLTQLLELYRQRSEATAGPDRARYSLLICEALDFQEEVVRLRKLNDQRLWALEAVKADPTNTNALAAYAKICLSLRLRAEVEEAIKRLGDVAPDDTRIAALRAELAELKALPEPTTGPASQPASQPTSGPTSQPASGPASRPASAPGA